MPTVDLISAIGLITGTLAMLVIGKGDIKLIIMWLLGMGCTLVLVEGMLCRF